MALESRIKRLEDKVRVQEVIAVPICEHGKLFDPIPPSDNDRFIYRIVQFGRPCGCHPGNSTGHTSRSVEENQGG